MGRRWGGVVVVALLFALFGPLPEAQAAIVRSAAGVTPVAIQGPVDQFRADLGGGLNPNVAGSFPSGRREINWDGVPDGFAAPNSLPANFFNANSPRGVELSTAGTGFQVSANSGVAPIEFDNINPTYSTVFQTLSPQRLFTAIGSNITDVTFFVPGTATPATVSGFGAVFTDVDTGASTSMQFFNQNGANIGTFPVQATNQGLSFLGVSFADTTDRISRVRITSGNAAVGPNDSNGSPDDIVVMDDFIYGEPQAPPSVDLYAVAFENQLFTFNSAAPGTNSPLVAITGLDPNEIIVCIDVRPATGVLYGLGSEGNLYTLNSTTGAATKVGSGGLPLSGQEFGMDFNPVATGSASSAATA